MIRLNIYTFFIVAILLLSSLSNPAYCQYYTLGGDPGRARWNVIRTDNFQLIYPAEIDSLARIYLAKLEGSRNAVNKSLDINPKRIPVVLHPYTTISNGSVAWAPKRMDLITTPDAYDAGSDPWTHHLVTHELRHVAQMEHYTKGIYNVFYYLLGEQVSGIGVGLFVHKYFLEGDAVISETEFSHGGRGRQADFTKFYRAMYLNGHYRNYDQLVLGSHKHYTPNEYAFGYALISYLRYKTDEYDINSVMFTDPVKYWYRPGYLLTPIKKATGLSIEEHLYNAQTFFTDMWKQDYMNRGEYTTPEAVELGRKQERLYTEVTNPIIIRDSLSPFDGHVLALKNGMQYAKSLILIDSAGKERFLHHFNPVSSRMRYHIGTGKVYWTETVSNEAVDLEDFSALMTMDVRSGKISRLSGRSRYFNPAPSVTGDTVAVAEYRISGSTSLTLLDAYSGKPLISIDAPDGGQIKEISFCGSRIHATVIKDKGLSICSYTDGKWEEILPQQHRGINGMNFHKGKLYFSSDLDGVVNIYEFDPETAALTRITNSEYGADYPYFDPVSGDLYYSEYSMQGYRAVVSNRNNLIQDSVSFSDPYKFPMAEILTRQMKEEDVDDLFIDTLNTFDTKRYPAKRYSKILNAFRIHSWMPVYVNIDRIKTFSLQNITLTASLGATVLSQNTLGNIVTTLGYGFVMDNLSGNFFHSGHAKINAKLFGNLNTEVSVDINERNSWTYFYDYASGKQQLLENSHTPLISTRVLVYYPLRIDSRGWYRSLTPQISWNFSNDRFYSFAGPANGPATEELNGKNEFRNELRYGISYGQIIPTADAQIYPRWGFGITVYGSSAPWSNVNFGHLAYLNGYIYLPGITRQQGLKLTATFQKQFSEGKLYYMSAFASLPRGYRNSYPSETFAMATIDYAIPIHLGDFRIGPVFYFQRLQLIPFADYAIDKSRNQRREYYSFGSDILVDFHFIRLGFPLSMGMRYAYTGPQADASRHYFGFLFNVSFN